MVSRAVHADALHSHSGSAVVIIDPDNVQLVIVQRSSEHGVAFTELLFEWVEPARSGARYNNVRRHALSRLDHLISNNAGTKKQQIAAFVRRREKWQ